jgi:truncated hemoglobin YjbI
MKGIVDGVVEEYVPGANHEFDGSGGVPVTSVYADIGGGALAEAVEAFYAAMLDDPVLARYFRGKDVDMVMAHQLSWLTTATGGPTHYVGRPLREAHARLRITREDFDRSLEHLLAACAGAGLTPDSVAAIRSRVVTFREHIVAPPDERRRR